MSADPVRPIIGIENRTPREVFDIMCDRITTLNAEVERWHEAYNIAHDQAMANGEAARAERPRIVAWLRSSAVAGMNKNDVANTIERGDHLKDPNCDR